MNLQNFTDQALLISTDELVKSEREILVQILCRFKEIERRRLYSDYGYSSLFDMARRRYGYSDDQCYRRIEAMRLFKELPEIEGKISSGELTLTNINLARQLFKQEEKLDHAFSREEKLELLEQISNKSTKEAEKVTLAHSSVRPAPAEDQICSVGNGQVKMTVTANEELETLIDELKKIYPNLSIGEILQVVCESHLQKPALTKKQEVATRKVNPNSKRQIRLQVRTNANHQCELCGSKHKPQIDHIIPRVKGGSDHPANLRLLCRSCNQRAAIKEFGAQKMAKYIT